MTIERIDAKGLFIYRICPTDPLVVERKVNRPGHRWFFYLRRDTPAEAKAALLNLKAGEEKE